LKLFSLISATATPENLKKESLYGC